MIENFAKLSGMASSFAISNSFRLLTFSLSFVVLNTNALA